MRNPLIEGLPQCFKDCLHTNTDIHFDWKDRLRILFGAKVALKCRTYCENIPGKVYSESEVNVGFPKRMRNQACEVVVAMPKDMEDEILNGNGTEEERNAFLNSTPIKVEANS